MEGSQDLKNGGRRCGNGWEEGGRAKERKTYGSKCIQPTFKNLDNDERRCFAKCPDDETIWLGVHGTENPLGVANSPAAQWCLPTKAVALNA